MDHSSSSWPELVRTLDPKMSKFAFVVGASRGIGEAVAVELARAGYSLYLFARSKPHLDSVTQQCLTAAKSAGHVQSRFEARGVDVLDEQQHIAVLSQCLGEIGNNLHSLVYAAGVFSVAHAGLDAGSFSQRYSNVFGLNVAGCFRSVNICYSALIAAGQKDGSSVVFLSSAAAKDTFPMPAHGLYFASKAAVSKFAMCLQNEVRHYGVKVRDCWLLLTFNRSRRITA